MPLASAGTIISFEIRRTMYHVSLNNSRPFHTQHSVGSCCVQAREDPIHLITHQKMVDADSTCDVTVAGSFSVLNKTH